MSEAKSRKGLIITVVGVVVVAAAVIAVLFARGESPAEQSGSADKIKIELRAYPTAEIRVDGKKIGKTPISLQYPRSDKEIDVEATLVRNLVGNRGGRKIETYQGVQRVKLDRDQLFDFTFENTKRVSVDEQKAND